MVKYRCTNCNYVFKPKTEGMPRRCPYCAEADKLVKDTNVVEDVLE